MRTLRQMWNDGEPTLGGWLSIPATLSAEVMARGGFDYVCIDTQHGAVDYQTTVELIRAVEHGGSRAIVRVPWNEPGIIGKMLDAGAEGVIVPMVNTVEQAEAAVRACRYAPHGGARSFGPTVAKLRHNDYVEWARDNVAVIPMIETAEALSNLDAIVQVDGIDAVYVGPADLAHDRPSPRKQRRRSGVRRRAFGHRGGVRRRRRGARHPCVWAAHTDPTHTGLPSDHRYRGPTRAW